MSSLDDFFAKKDRKKSATKTNLLAADELYRTLKETARTSLEVDSNKNLQEDVANSSLAPLEFGIRFSDETIDEEDEWCDFTEEYEQPFPNLKRCSKLLLNSAKHQMAQAEDSKVIAEHQDTGGDGLDVGRSSEDFGKSSCPWVKIEPTELSNMSPKTVESLEKKPQAAKMSPTNIQSKKQVYVPPALRHSHSALNVRPKKHTSSTAIKLAKGQAPDLNNAEYFPTLCQSRSSKRAK